MAKKVTFKNESGYPLYVELGPKTNFEKTDKAFNNEFDGYAEIYNVDVYGQFYLSGDTDGKPYAYFRHTDVKNGRYRFGNVVELGDTPYEPQKGVLHRGEVADKDTPLNTYRKISDEPLSFGFDSEDPKVEFRVYDNYATMKEGDFLSLKGEPWPFTLYDHQSLYENCSIVFQPCTWSGMLDGKRIVGIGSYDRFCLSKGAKFDNLPLGYIAFNGISVRDDGRKEFTFFSCSLNGVGKTIAYYICEGEKPVITDSFTMEADWYHLPYVNDGTCCFKEAVFYFLDKEIHFTGKWGTKGFTDEPRIERHGQSQIYGTWYEGKTPYKHRMEWCMSENMEAFDYVLKKAGFDIVDD